MLTRLVRATAAVLLTLGTTGGAFAADPDSVSFTLEGCRQESLPDGYDIEGNGFLCDVGAGVDGYTTGNLGKEWNELDLVPWRVTASAGNSAPATQTYTVTLTVDYEDAGAPGYDVITTPTLNPSSHASCQLAFSGQLQLLPGVGGTDESAYRFLTITQDKNTECVIDGQARLALGSHLFPGSSLHFNLLNEDLEQAGVGNKDVSIPVNEILPQELDKDMTATQDTDFAWNVTKGPNPATLDFGDTCAPGADLDREVQIRVDWEILPGAPGMVMVVTNITATNPASRTITVDVTDEIFGDVGNGKELLHTDGSGPVNVPANTSMTVHTSVFDAPANVTDLMDVATATYTDLVTGVPIPGETEAMASALIQPGTQTNTSAVISDSESISGAGLSFSVDSTSGASGSFDGYVLGTPTTGPVDWDSDTQTGDGFVVFTKTVSVDEPRITSGSLSDTATLNASDGFTTNANASVSLSSNALVELTINKTIPDILQGDETVEFQFDVEGPGGFQDTVFIVFNAGEISNSTTLSGLEPGNYVVTEQPTVGFVPVGGNEKNANIVLPSCDGSVSFENVIPGDEFARAQVQKITLPAGSEAGWKMTLSGPGGPEDLVTTGTGFHGFALLLEEGSYTITEEQQAGWDLTMTSAGCSFTVDYPRDFGATFSCTLENTQRGRILIDKQTDPAQEPDLFDFTLTGGPDALNVPFQLADESPLFDSGLVRPGSYTASETVPAGWDLVDVDCNDANSSGDEQQAEASITLDPGETVTCTFTNRKRGMVDLVKLTNGVEDPNMAWTFTLSGPEVNTSDSTPPAFLDFGGAKLIPGETYTLCETGIPSSWTVMWSLDVDGSGTFNMPPDEVLPFVGAATGGLYEVYDPTFGEDGASNDTRCVDFSVDAGETLHFVIDNQRPGGEPRTIGFWKNWNTCTGGNQVNTAAGNGGPNEGWFLLDDLLPQTIGDLTVTTCEDGAALLDKSSLDGKKRANDGAYEVASQLLAAKLNLSAGAETCQAVVDAVADGDALLSQLGFDGTGKYLTPKDKSPLRNEALGIATELDDYNNGELCQ